MDYFPPWCYLHYLETQGDTRHAEVLVPAYLPLAHHPHRPLNHPLAQQNAAGTAASFTAVAAAAARISAAAVIGVIVDVAAAATAAAVVVV
jgi:hypothetical protein